MAKVSLFFYIGKFSCFGRYKIFLYFQTLFVDVIDNAIRKIHKNEH